LFNSLSLTRPAPEINNSDQEANITVTGQEDLDKEEEQESNS
jgi:hypothetical protein